VTTSHAIAAPRRRLRHFARRDHGRRRRHARCGRSLAAPPVTVASVGADRVAAGWLPRTGVRPDDGPDDDRDPGLYRFVARGIRCGRRLLAGDTGDHLYAVGRDHHAARERLFRMRGEDGSTTIRGSVDLLLVRHGRVGAGPPERAARGPGAVRWLHVTPGRAPRTLERHAALRRPSSMLI